MSDQLHDLRPLHVFMPSQFDDLPLTLEAFRVYCHLARRADKSGKSFPSLVKIGEHCFRGSYPNSSPASLKAKAIAAIKELCTFGLIRKELYDEGEGYRHNNYFLTNSNEWEVPSRLDTNSCNVRKGRPGRTRSKNNATEENETRLTGITSSVNRDNRVNQANSVNRDNPTRLTGITSSVNRTLPKGISNEGISNEGKERSLVGVRDTEIADAIAHKKSHPRSRSRLSEEPSQRTDVSDSPSAKKGRSPKTKPFVEGKGSALPRRCDLNKMPPDEVYARVKRHEEFEHFWIWYCKNCKRTVDTRGRNPNAGGKKAAAIAWIEVIDPMSPEQYERFREGCRAFDWSQVGIPHASVYLRGSLTDERGPYWESALEQQEALATPDNDPSAIAPVVPVAADLAESLMSANPETHPWCGDRAHLLGFLEYLVNTGDRRKSGPERRQIGVSIVRRANVSVAGSIDHQKALHPWFLFLENASTAQTIQQATGADRVPAVLRRAIEQLDAKERQNARF